MLAGLRALFPKNFESRAGGIAAATLVAVAFGLGHLPQGWGGVALTTFLGAGLGAIIVLHRPIWDAVLAHGFFDATTFAALYLIAKFAPQVLSGG
jgi:membrane protease YdiL (CAAX protease family)